MATKAISNPGPDMRLTFTNPNGSLTRVGYELLLSFLTRTGGQSGVDSGDLSQLIADLQQLVGEQGADIDDLEVQGAAGPDAGAVLQSRDERGEGGDASYLTAVTSRLAEIELQLEQYRGADALFSKIHELEARIADGFALPYDPISGLGTMSTQNASAVAITGGSGIFSTLQSLANTFIGNVTSIIASSTGRIFVAIRGSTAAGGIEMSTSAADADATLAGVMQWSDANGTGAERRLASIQGFTSGTTATNRGGVISFTTKADGGGLTEAARITNTQRMLLGTTTDDGVNKLQVNGSIAMAPATTTTAPAAGGAGALPATPTGYATMTIGGTVRKLAYY